MQLGRSEELVLVELLLPWDLPLEMAAATSGRPLL